MASSCAALVFLLLAPAAAGALRGGALSVADLITAAHIQPEAVSHLLSEVERQWEAEALSVLQGKADAASSLGAMVDSCSKVSKAIVGGSEGNKDKVVEYLKEVCRASAAGQDDLTCHQYATAFEAHLSDDLNANREDLNVGGFCQAFYKGSVTDAAKKQQTKLAANEQVEAAKLAANEQVEAKAKSVEETEAAESKDRTEFYIMSKAAHEHLQQVKEMMARATQNFAAVTRDSSAGSHAETEELVERARKATKIADEKAAQLAEEKEAEEAEAKAKAAREKVEEFRNRKAKAQEAAAEEAKAAEKKAAEKPKVALVARKGRKAAA